ncbi:hypothetical protein IVA95_27830 [Bradyrhizobium sp. 157]|uniref:hypothetical protein n=1 Tax=Bradyrhizobium sp. 157 TaxID=2782631 RepID=UPI001FF7001E|nr:hypothetical protein [Bradyrhizobium sp. 157]MCK1641288.1 hypothetical protein [Bradyrhizobium sp. 157]
MPGLPMKLSRLILMNALTKFVLGAKATNVNVASAAIFTELDQEIAAAFKQKTDDEAVLSFGASRWFYSQIMPGAVPGTSLGRRPSPKGNWSRMVSPISEAASRTRSARSS